MSSKDTSCVFCNIRDSKAFFMESDLCFALFDNFPVSNGHCLIIPKRHTATFFDLTQDEIKDMHTLSLKVKEHLDELYHPDGYNVGFNCGEHAGQTVMHAHMHVIPRYIGDSDNPRGGLRKIINSLKTSY